VNSDHGTRLSADFFSGVKFSKVTRFKPKMGLLSEGSPLSWKETKKLSDHVRKHGIIQFINLYKRLRDRQGDVLKWGDEVVHKISADCSMLYRNWFNLLYHSQNVASSCNYAFVP